MNKQADKPTSRNSIWTTLVKLFKGLLVGASSILPGFSGGMVAASANIYEDLVAALANFSRHPIKAVLSIWQYLVGLFIGILLAFYALNYILDFAPIASTIFFIGLILGSIPFLIRMANKGKKYDAIGMLITFIFAMLMILLFYVQYQGQVAADIENMHWYVQIGVGLVMAIAFVIPGFSGATMLMILGIYTVLVSTVESLIDAVLTWTFAGLGQSALAFLVIMATFAVMVVVLAKIINRFIKKFPHRFYQAVIGIVIISPANILIAVSNSLADTDVNIFDFTTNWVQWTIGIVLGILGLIGIIYLMRDKTKKKQPTPLDGVGGIDQVMVDSMGQIIDSISHKNDNDDEKNIDQ